MITVFHRMDGRIAEIQQQSHQNVPDDPVWIDLTNPTDDELKNLPQNLNIALPSRKDIWRNHALSRMYSRDGTAYMTAAIPNDSLEFSGQTSTITFILTPDFLITIREIDPKPFLKFQERLLLNPRHYLTGSDVLEGLLDDILTHIVTLSDKVIKGLDRLSSRIFRDHAFDSHEGNPSLIMHGVLNELGALADLNSRVHESLHSLRRLLSYFKHDHNAGDARRNHTVDILIKDTQSLSEQTSFLSTKINFQLDASLGMINVEQNLIVKVFSMAAVFFLPPTLIAGVYGMNFDHMPELHWGFGYPAAIGLMVIAALIPFVYFTKKRWL